MPPIALHQLATLCQRRVPATLATRDGSPPQMARLWSADPSRLSLRLRSGATPSAWLQTNAEIQCAFHDGPRVLCFRSKVLEVVRDAEGRALGVRLAVPTMVENQDRRGAFRVPVLAPMEVRATLMDADRVVEVGVLDLSLRSARLKLPPNLEIVSGTRCLLRLETRDHRASVPGTLVRDDRGRVLVQFRSTSSDPLDDTPHRALETLVRAIERRWLKIWRS